MSEAFDERRLRDLERHLTVDDALFVDAFRSRSALMPDARRRRADLRMIALSLRWTAATAVLVLMTAGAYAGAAGLCVLLLAGLSCARHCSPDSGTRAGPTRHRTLTRRRDVPPT